MATKGSVTQEEATDLAVEIFGVINDEKFEAKGTGRGAPGHVVLQIEYSSVPEGWHPLVYCDPLINLAFLDEAGGARNLDSLTGCNYRAQRIMDFGSGYFLRGTASIRREGAIVVGDYSLVGTLRVPDLIDAEPFEELMIPSGPGGALGVGSMRLLGKNGDKVEALVATRYFFDKKARIPFPQIRRWKGSLRVDDRVFVGEYQPIVRPMPAVKEGSAYIGHLIA